MRYIWLYTFLLRQLLGSGNGAAVTFSLDGRDLRETSVQGAHDIFRRSHASKSAAQSAPTEVSTSKSAKSKESKSKRSKAKSTKSSKASKSHHKQEVETLHQSHSSPETVDIPVKHGSSHQSRPAQSEPLSKYPFDSEDEAEPILPPTLKSSKGSKSKTYDSKSSKLKSTKSSKTKGGTIHKKTHQQNDSHKQISHKSAKVPNDRQTYAPIYMVHATPSPTALATSTPIAIMPFTDSPTFSPTVFPTQLTRVKETKESNTDSLVPMEDNTESPTEAPFLIKLADVSLVYNLNADRAPRTDERVAVVDLTSSYLNDFAKQRVHVLYHLENEFLNSTYSSGFYRMDFKATAFFVPSRESEDIADEIEFLLGLAFTGESADAYIKLLRQLPQDNIFASTRFVNEARGDIAVGSDQDGNTDDNDLVVDGHTSKGARTRSVVVAVGGAAIFASILFVVAMHRKSRERKATEGEKDGFRSGGTFVGPSNSTHERQDGRASHQYWIAGSYQSSSDGIRFPNGSYEEHGYSYLTGSQEERLDLRVHERCLDSIDR